MSLFLVGLIIKVMKVAILIPTLNRPSFIQRTVTYYDSLKSPHPIYIGDASNTEISENTLSFLKKVKNVEVKYFHWAGRTGEKTTTKLAKFSSKGGLYIVVLTDPTTGGISASIGMLGDIILSEPDALICFAGPRVIKQTIGQDLPEGFQRSEFLLKKGFIDNIVQRKELKSTLTSLIKLLKKG